MNDKQETKLSMFIAVRDFIIANESELNELPSFSTFSEPFNTIVEQIQSISAEQVTNRTGFAITKAEIKNELIAQAADMSRKLVAFAEVVGNSTLKAEVDYSQSALRNTSDSVLKNRCETIWIRADSHLEDLTPYKVTDTLVEKLRTQITAFLTAIPQPKTARSGRKLITDELKALFDQADALLKNKIDRLVETVRTTDTHLYNAYRSARTLINEFGRRKLAVKVNVTDNAGMPLGMVVATVDGTHTAKKTTEKGRFQVEVLAAGTYNFNFRKNGYKPATATVNVNDGETTKVEVVMERVHENVSILA